jgi:hypothetical protein
MTGLQSGGFPRHGVGLAVTGGQFGYDAA